MNLEHPTLAIRRGNFLDSVQQRLALTQPSSAMANEDGSGCFYHLPDLGFWVFFDQSNQVYSIRFDDGYPYEIEGIHIGDTQETVLIVRGKPDRRFLVPDNKDRWLYDKPHFLRVDFDPETNRVEKIFR